MGRKLQLSPSILLGVLLATVQAATADVANPRFTGAPFLRVWTAEDYGAAPSNRAIIAHPNTGFIYAGNADGVLEFDGVRWRLLTAPGGLGVHTLTIDARGRVWFATDDEVGFLRPDDVGELQAVSARARLPAGEPPIFPLGNGVATADGVYFVNGDRVICFPTDDGPARIWRFPGRNLFSQPWLMDGTIHIRAANAVVRRQGHEFVPVPGLRTFAFATTQLEQGGWLQASRDGLRRWDGAYRPVAPGTAPLVSPLEGDFALNAAFLSEGRVAFGTSRSGLVLSDRAGQRLQIVDRARGLPSNRVEAQCSDRAGGVWLAFRNGLARVQLDSPFARHGIVQRRIDSTPQALALHNGDLYVGGGEGLSRRDAAGIFHPVRDVPYLVRNLVSHDGNLFVTGIELRLVNPDDTTRRLDATYYGLVPLAAMPGHFVHGNNEGVAFDRFDGKNWTRLGQHAGITGATTVLAESPAGVVWAANHTTGLWRIDFRSGLRDDAPARNFGPADGLPARLNQYNVELLPLGPGLDVIAAGRLLHFDESAGRFAPETRIDGLPPGRGDVQVGRASPPLADGTFWLQLREPVSALARIAPAGSGRWRAELNPSGPGRLRATALLPDPASHTLWIAGASALISQDLAWQPTPGATPAPVRPVVRQLLDANGDVLWADGHTSELGVKRPPATLTLPPQHNALRVLFALPAFAGDHAGHAHLQFRTQLVGLDQEWTAWTAEAQRDFTNLPYRSFELRLQARDDAGHITEAAGFSFSILAPWWRTGWAFAVYGLAGIAGIGGIVASRTRMLRRRNEQLEGVIAERTEALRHSNAELARLNVIERDEKLAARLSEEKARLEVLRYQLNPHFLFNALNSVCASINHAPSTARGMVVQIADFCRQTLHRPGQETGATTIGDELKMLRSYLDIEKARLGELLEVEIETDPETAAVRIPPFLLLPLVENAVKYGTATSVERVEIRLGVRHVADDVVEIEVANTGEWLEAGHASTPSTGIGLENLRQRLARYYPDAHELTTSADGGWVTVRLRLHAAMRATTVERA